MAVVQDSDLIPFSSTQLTTFQTVSSHINYVRINSIRIFFIIAYVTENVKNFFPVSDKSVFDLDSVEFFEHRF